MCLNTITVLYDGPKVCPEPKIGYKVLVLNGLNEWRSPVLGAQFVMGGEYLDTYNSKLGSGYTSGYHIFISYQDALNYITDYCERVVKVEYNNITAIGEQHIMGSKNLTVVVAKWMKLIEVVT